MKRGRGGPRGDQTAGGNPPLANKEETTNNTSIYLSHSEAAEKARVTTHKWARKERQRMENGGTKWENQKMELEGRENTLEFSIAGHR